MQDSTIQSSLKSMLHEYLRIREITFAMTDAAIEENFNDVLLRREGHIARIEEIAQQLDNLGDWRARVVADGMLSSLNKALEKVIRSITDYDALFMVHIEGRMGALQTELRQLGKTSSATSSYIRMSRLAAA